MRFVSSLPPPLVVPEEEEPVPTRAIRQVKPVVPRSRMPEAIQHFDRNRARHEGGAASGPTLVRLEQRSEKERRGWCRRLQREQPFLNTRSGVERRQNPRRTGDQAVVVNEEV